MTTLNWLHNQLHRFMQTNASVEVRTVSGTKHVGRIHFIYSVDDQVESIVVRSGSHDVLLRWDVVESVRYQHSPGEPDAAPAGPGVKCEHCGGRIAGHNALDAHSIPCAECGSRGHAYCQHRNRASLTATCLHCGSRVIIPEHHSAPCLDCGSLDHSRCIHHAVAKESP